MAGLDFAQDDKLERKQVSLEEHEEGNDLVMQPVLSRQHTFPHAKKTETSERVLPAAEFVGDVPYTSEQMIQSIENLSFNEYASHITFADQNDGAWHIPKNLPAPILDIFRAVLSHEAAINPQIDQYVGGTVDIRLIGPEHNQEWTRENMGQHLDGISTSYIVSSAPTTIQYVGALKGGYKTREYRSAAGNGEEWSQRPAVSKSVVPSSLLPMKLYRYDETLLHSVPWNIDSLTEPRFFCRIGFQVKRKS